MSLIKLTCACLLLTAAVAVFTIAFGTEQAAKPGMELCKHQYALCTSALCIPQPDDPTKAICFCAVEDGASMSSVACNSSNMAFIMWRSALIMSSECVSRCLSSASNSRDNPLPSPLVSHWAGSDCVVLWPPAVRTTKAYPR